MQKCIQQTQSSPPWNLPSDCGCKTATNNSSAKDSILNATHLPGPRRERSFPVGTPQEDFMEEVALEQICEGGTGLDRERIGEDTFN